MFAIGFIYKATNIANGKMYIGQTSQSINNRWKQHLYESTHESGSSYNNYISCAIRKYGAESFSVEEVERCDNSMLNEREKYWIKKFDAINSGYNLTPGGKGRQLYSDDDILRMWNTGKAIRQISEEYGISRQLLRDRLKTLGITKDDVEKRGYYFRCKKARKPIYQYGLDGNFVAEYPSTKEAQKMLKNSGIKSAVNGALLTAAGYQWRKYKVDKIEPVSYEDVHVSRPVYQYSADGEYIRGFSSASSAAKEMELDLCRLHYACQGKQMTHAGFQWRYEKFDRISPSPIKWQKSKRHVA